MPAPPTRDEKHHRTGTAHRIERIANPEIVLGPDTFVKSHQDGGITIGQSRKRIVLTHRQARKLIDAATELLRPDTTGRTLGQLVRYAAADPDTARTPH